MRWPAVVPTVVAVAAVAAVAACGPPAETPTAPPATTEPTPGPGSGGPDGAAAADALAGFRCGPDRRGSWTATGALTNDGAARAAYVVTVVVAGPTGGEARAKRQVLELASGDTTDVELTDLPVPTGGELSCQAQVVRRR